MTTPTPDPTGGPSWTTPGASGQPPQGGSPAPGWIPPTPVGPSPGYGQQPGYGMPVAPPAPAQQVPGAPGGPGAWSPWKPPAAQPGIVPLRPLTLMEILDGAFRAIRSNPAVMFGLSAAVVVVAIALSTVLGIYVTGLLSGSWMNLPSEIDPATTKSLETSLSTSIPTFISSIIMLFTNPILTGLLITSVSRSVIGQKISMSEAWRLTKGRRARLLGFSMALVLAEIVAVGIAIGFVALVATSGSGGAAVLVGLLCLVAFIVLGAWVTIRTLLVPASLVLEGTSFRRGIARGWRLTYGSFWRLFGIYLLVTVMMWVLTSLLSVPAGMISGVLALQPNLETLSVIITSVSLAITNTVTVSYLSSAVALLYIDLRIRREGLDVELARAAGEAA